MIQGVCKERVNLLCETFDAEPLDFIQPRDRIQAGNFD